MSIALILSSSCKQAEDTQRTYKKDSRRAHELFNSFAGSSEDTEEHKIAMEAGEAIPSEATMRIVVDPGHGGFDFGGRYQGTKESKLTLDIAKKTAVVLRHKLPFANVILTRLRDEMMDLDERTAIANATGADLFVSIHLNAADDTIDRGGVTTFVLDTSRDEQALALAARENGTTQDEVTGLQKILASLVRSDQLIRSRRLAESVQHSTVYSARLVLPALPDRGVKSAAFRVLVGARMPAILVEASFLTHPEEWKMLQTVRYRQALAEGIADGVVQYTARHANHELTSLPNGY